MRIDTLSKAVGGEMEERKISGWVVVAGGGGGIWGGGGGGGEGVCNGNPINWIYLAENVFQPSWSLINPCPSQVAWQTTFLFYFGRSSAARRPAAVSGKWARTSSSWGRSNPRGTEIEPIDSQMSHSTFCLWSCQWEWQTCPKGRVLPSTFHVNFLSFFILLCVCLFVCSFVYVWLTLKQVESAVPLVPVQNAVAIDVCGHHEAEQAVLRRHEPQERLDLPPVQLPVRVPVHGGELELRT